MSPEPLVLSIYFCAYVSRHVMEKGYCSYSDAKMAK
jgi:hypothetical protein